MTITREPTQPDERTELREPIPGNIEIRQRGNRVAHFAQNQKIGPVPRFLHRAFVSQLRERQLAGSTTSRGDINLRVHF